MNKGGALEIVLAVLPGLICTAIFNNDMFLVSSFFAVCSLLPYNKSYFDRYVPLLHLALIYSLGYAASLLLRSGSIGAYSGLLLLTALGCGMLETHVLSMRTAVSWIMIGVIYSSFKFTHYTAAELTIKNLLLVFTIAIVGTLAAMFCIVGNVIELSQRASVFTHRTALAGGSWSMADVCV